MSRADLCYDSNEALFMREGSQNCHDEETVP
mgnify:CR=1 FL=1|jgi:hypothetical protein